MTVILIDGKNCIFRYGYAQKFLETEDGIKTGAIYGTLKCLLRMKKRYPDARFVFVWDGDRKENSWRFKIHKEYQLKRQLQKAQPMPTDVKDILAQIPYLMEILTLLAIIQIKVPEVEADDVIAILAARCIRHKLQPVVYSSDKDFIQLIRYGVVVLRNVDKSDSFKPETKTTVKERFGCTPDQLIKVRAIAGDTTDGLPNPVKGIGAKTAAKLVAMGVDPSIEAYISEESFGKLDKTWQRLYKAWPKVHLNYRLMKLPLSCNDKVFSENKLLRYGVENVFTELQLPLTPMRKLALECMARLQLAEAIDARQQLFQLQKI